MHDSPRVSGGKQETAGVCVVGGGYWGKNLIRNFWNTGRLKGVCDVNTRTLDEFVVRYPGIRVYDLLSQALDDDDIDALAIATPAEQHYSMVMAGIESGRDVFVEKPLALDAEDGLEMVEAAEDRGLVLMVGHLLRYHPAILKIRTLVQDGILGRVDYIYSNRLSMGKIRKEENALWSFAPHDISVILSLINEMPVQVTATGGAYLQPNIADVTVSNLLFDRGTRSHIFVSWLHPYKEQKLVIVGSKQMLVFEDSRAENKLMLFDKHIEWKDGNMEATKPQGTSVHFDADEPLRRECEHFVDCIVNRKEPLTSGREGLRVLQVLQACQRSLQMNGEPVQVLVPRLQRILAV